ncbi:MULTISPECIES: hypothetical protein [unclassified Mesorhizobium]|uniref:hypothetical protein n=1 Tax=unclassified Mesorhizobium TaxID=325217 RepID=UPI0024161971|nr:MULTISPECIES: hypothetical protein [unclassified Mesorhizobium]WFP61460.1 hypothetical protein QAZ47_23680 [Mesorhizobium sp. WSM4904]WFP74763.1 hypothetical protein QAZ22_23940 [Mesorhizobium sp. WSM4906]
MALGLASAGGAIPANRKEFTEFQSAALVSVLRQISGLTGFMAETLFLEGRLQTKEMNLVARTMTFSPNTKLIFPASSPTGLGNSIFIVADTIKVSGDVEITWSRPVGQGKMPPRGRAPDGIAARDPGQPGARGYDGEAGNAGVDGASAPGLVLLFRHIEGEGSIRIDVSGMDGQPGGEGQTGGRGGTGAAGADSIGKDILKNLFVSQTCIRPPTAGGSGGDGGNGGNGGGGGNGGSSGDVLVFTSSADELQKLEVQNNAGLGAESGRPGDGGPPGAGGLAGRDFGRCGIMAQNGLDGAPGRSGSAGPAGRIGLNGVVGFATLSEQQMSAVFNPVRQ